jgi:hypothetical protein
MDNIERSQKLFDDLTAAMMKFKYDGGSVTEYLISCMSHCIALCHLCADTNDDFNTKDFLLKLIDKCPTIEEIKEQMNERQK